MLISSLYVLEQPVRADLKAEPYEVTRIKRKIEDVRTACVLGSRDPRLHHEYTKIAGSAERYTFYRKWVGRDKFRLVFEVSGKRMVLVAVIEKDDQAYSISKYVSRMNDWEEQ